MEWLKHDTNFWDDPKIKRLIRRFGLEGPSLYLYIRDSVGKGIDSRHVGCTTDLTTEDLAIEFPKMTLETIEAIINVLMERKTEEERPLLDREPITGKLRCLKILTRLNPNQVRNHGIQEMVNEARRFEREGVQRGSAEGQSIQKDEKERKSGNKPGSSGNGRGAWPSSDELFEIERKKRQGTA